MTTLLPSGQVLGSYPSLYSVLVYPATTRIELAGIFVLLYAVLVVFGAIFSSVFLVLSRTTTWPVYAVAFIEYFDLTLPFVLS